MKKIDIHVHSTVRRGLLRTNGTTYATPEELREIYDRLGIERGVNLPSCIPECSHHVITNEEAAELARAHPETYLFFCNIDPRWGDNSPDTDLSRFLLHYKALGARGVGEITAQLDFDDPRVYNLFAHAESCGMPLTFHVGDPGCGDYGLIDALGLPKLERALAAFPKLVFLGHSQKFWAEISGDLTAEQRNGYPTGPVAPGGRIEALMTHYPNLHGDLSAWSGFNALSRDPEHAYRFLEKFQDRLYFGTDCCSPTDDFPLSAWLDEAVEAGRISRGAYEKIGWGNASRLLGL
jgi:uncharacterized protein